MECKSEMLAVFRTEGCIRRLALTVTDVNITPSIGNLNGVIYVQILSTVQKKLIENEQWKVTKFPWPAEKTIDTN